MRGYYHINEARLKKLYVKKSIYFSKDHIVCSEPACFALKYLFPEKTDLFTPLDKKMFKIDNESVYIFLEYDKVPFILSDSGGDNIIIIK